MQVNTFLIFTNYWCRTKSQRYQLHVGLIHVALLVEHCTCIAEVMGSTAITDVEISTRIRESSRLQKRCLATLFAQWDPMVRQVNINVCLEPTEAKTIEL